jgi:hypothetical protein
MTIARPVRPTDLVALAASRLQINEAITWDHLGRSSGASRLLWPAMESWATLNVRPRIWVCTRHGLLVGAASARPRGGRLAWEIDRLALAGDADPDVAEKLLDAAATDAVAERVTRIFLRLRSERVEALHARRAAFAPYLTERLYALHGDLIADGGEVELPWRRRQRIDGFPLFRLYNAVTPLSVRQHEAISYAEWIAAQERRGRCKLDHVLLEDGEARAWVRAMMVDRVGRIDLLLGPETAGMADTLLAQAVRALGARRPVYVLVPAYAEATAALLERHGFVAEETYTSLVRRLVVLDRLAEPTRSRARHPLVPA